MQAGRVAVWSPFTPKLMERIREKTHRLRCPTPRRDTGWGSRGPTMGQRRRRRPIVWTSLTPALLVADIALADTAPGNARSTKTAKASVGDSCCHGSRGEGHGTPGIPAVPLPQGRFLQPASPGDLFIIVSIQSFGRIHLSRQSERPTFPGDVIGMFYTGEQ